MIVRKITLKSETTDKTYRELIETAEAQGIFVACGNCDDKWIIAKFENGLDYLAWLVAMGFAEMEQT